MQDSDDDNNEDDVDDDEDDDDEMEEEDEEEEEGEQVSTIEAEAAELELISNLSARMSVTQMPAEPVAAFAFAFPFRLCVRLCLRRSQFRRKTLPHDEQLYGLMSVWVSRCVFRFERWLKLRLQTGHLCGDSSKWRIL